MLKRSEVEANLQSLTQRAAQLADHMERAAKTLDTLTVTDCTSELHEIELKIDEACFQLDLLAAVEQVD